MRQQLMVRAGLLWLLTLGAAGPGGAQVTEIIGSRALGMGGAFVAVASDSSATWWNPAGLGAGPFVDLALAKTQVETDDRLPALRHRVSSFAVTTPPIGFAYYRFRITDIQPFDPTGQGGAGREDKRAGVPVRSLSASQVGVTLVRTLIPGVHAGTTLKYVRGTLRGSVEDSAIAPRDLLQQGDALGDGEAQEAQGRFDADVGVLAVTGPIRLGARIRNVLQPEFDVTGAMATERAWSVRLPRQVRVGVAFDPEAATGIPLTVALDMDARAYDTPSGSRRVLALGVEQWLLAKRVGVRAGGRANTVGVRERSATVGMSVAVRAGLYVDGYLVRAESSAEKGWGLAARVSF